MRVLVGCECSGVVRRAFRALGHDAWSCDLKSSEDGGEHFQEDIFEAMERVQWDLMIVHPPCDYLSVSGNRWFSDSAKASPGVLTGEARRKAQRDAVKFVEKIWERGNKIPKVALENPISRLSTLWKKPSQTIQPWQFWLGEVGKGEVKATCLWLRGLSKLVPTTPFETGRHPACWLQPPSPNRKADRARTYQGIAEAMALQWTLDTY